MCVKRGVTCSLVPKDPKHGTAGSTEIPQDPAGPFHPPQPDHRTSTDTGLSLDPVQIIGMMTVRGEQKGQRQPADYVERMRGILCSHGPEEAMRQLLSDNQSPSLSLLRQIDAQFEDFAEEHQKTYVEVFHEAWPFVHVITLDVVKDNLHLASSIITIGILLKKDGSEASRSKVLSCHELMMGQFFQRLVGVLIPSPFPANVTLTSRALTERDSSGSNNPGVADGMVPGRASQHHHWGDTQ